MKKLMDWIEIVSLTIICVFLLMKIIEMIF